MADSNFLRNAQGWRRVRFLVRPKELELGEHRLSGAQSHYLTSVLRLKPGMVVHPFDGTGNEAVATICSASQGRCVIKVTGKSEYAPADAKTRIHVGQGMTSRNRLDVAVEKLTEAGAASITAITSFGGARVDKEGSLGKRWSRITGSATAQCGRMRLPEIGEQGSLDNWNSWLPNDCLRLLLSPSATMKLSDASRSVSMDKEVALLIGRVSGLDEKEEKHAKDLGFMPVSIGDRILRVETVGVFAMGILLAAAGEC